MYRFLGTRNGRVVNFWPPEMNFWPPEFYLGRPEVDVCISGGQKWACGQFLATRNEFLATRILLGLARSGCVYFWWPEMGMWPISGHQKLISGDQNSTWVGQKWMFVFLVARNGHVANFWPPEIKLWAPEFYLG